MCSTGVEVGGLDNRVGQLRRRDDELALGGEHLREREAGQLPYGAHPLLGRQRAQRLGLGSQRLLGLVTQRVLHAQVDERAQAGQGHRAGEREGEGDPQPQRDPADHGLIMRSDGA